MRSYLSRLSLFILALAVTVLTAWFSQSVEAVPALDFTSAALPAESAHLTGAGADAPSAQKVAPVGYIGGQATAVATADSYLYVGMGSNIFLFTLTTPGEPALVGQVDLSDEVEAIALAGKYAYVAAADAGLRVLDISIPTAPQEVGSYITAGPAYGVAIAGRYAYVAAAGAGLRVVDVSEPVEPVEVGGHVTSDQALKVAVTGSYAYVAAEDAGLRVIDVSTPSSPQEAGFYDPSDPITSVAMAGEYAYVTGHQSGLRVLNISTPPVPHEVGFADNLGYAQNLTLAGNHAYVTILDGALAVVDISTPSSPQKIGFLDTPGHGWDVDVGANHAYLAAGDGGMRIIELATPSAPKEIGFYDTLGETDIGAVAVAGDYAYIGNYDNLELVKPPSGLQIVDVAAAVSPRNVGFFSTPDYVQEVAIAGRYAYVATGSSGLRVVDIATPSLPQEVGVSSTPGAALAVTLAGDYAYVVGEDLWVVDVSLPSAPQQVSSYALPGTAQDVAVTGDYLVIAEDGYRAGEGWAGLRVFDLSDPALPAEAGVYERTSFGSANAVATAGNYAYLGVDYAGLLVIDLSNPAAPQAVGAYTTPSTYVQDVLISGHYLFLTSAGSGVRVLDISEPAAPQEVGFYEVGGVDLGLVAADSYLYAAVLFNGLFVLRPAALTNPAHLPLSISHDGSTTHLSWSPPPTDPPPGYNIYRDAGPYSPSLTTVYSSTTGTTWSDPGGNLEPWFYTVAGSDFTVVSPRVGAFPFQLVPGG